MEKEHLEILLEEMRSKCDLVLEGHAALNAKIDVNQAKNDEKFDLIDFQLKALNTKIDTVRDESNQKHEQTATLLKAIAKDLVAHRADTEAHPRWQVREPSE